VRPLAHAVCRVHDADISDGRDSYLADADSDAATFESVPIALTTAVWDLPACAPVAARAATLPAATSLLPGRLRNATRGSPWHYRGVLSLHAPRGKAAPGDSSTSVANMIPQKSADASSTSTAISDVDGNDTGGDDDAIALIVFAVPDPTNTAAAATVAPIDGLTVTARVYKGDSTLAEIVLGKIAVPTDSGLARATSNTAATNTPDVALAPDEVGR